MLLKNSEHIERVRQNHHIIASRNITTFNCAHLLTKNTSLQQFCVYLMNRENRITDLTTRINYQKDQVLQGCQIVNQMRCSVSRNVFI